MNAGSFPQGSKDWSRGAAFNAPSAVYGSGASFHEGFASLKSLDWAKSSNSGNSFLTQGRVNTQIQILPVVGENDECADWHKQLYRQYVFQFTSPVEREHNSRDIFRYRDRKSLLNLDSTDPDSTNLYSTTGGPFSKTQPNNEGSPLTSVVTVAQINYKLHQDALNNKEWTIFELKQMFIPIGVAITPDHTMQPYNGDGVLHTVIQRSGLTDVYNMWMDLENHRCPRKGDNLYFIFKPVPLKASKYGVMLAFNSEKVLMDKKSGKTPASYKWEVVPWFTSDGVDPSPKEYRDEFGGKIVWGDYVHCGRVDEVLAVQNMLDGGDLDKAEDLHKNVVNLIRSRTGLVINLTARRNIPVHF